MAGEFPSLCRAVRSRAGEHPFELAVILGSGLGAAADGAGIRARFDLEAFDELPRARVSGHAGELAAGTLGQTRTLFFFGRCHLYEGYDARTVTAPVRLAAELGCRKLLVTNAAGGIRPDSRPGDFMFVTDHLNLLGDNPLRGEARNPFIDLCGLYRSDLYPPLAEFAASRSIRIFPGVLAACPGPSYETPAEVRALGLLGAGAVSMSTVPEAIMARYLGLEVLGLSLIANRAAGLAPGPLDHREVLAAGREAGGNAALLLGEAVRLWFASGHPEAP